MQRSIDAARASLATDSSSYFSGKCGGAERFSYGLQTIEREVIHGASDQLTASEQLDIATHRFLLDGVEVFCFKVNNSIVV